MADIELLVPEYEYRQRGLHWHLATVAVAVVLGLLGWLSGNLTFTGFVALAWLALLLKHLKKPRLMSLKIDESGVTLGNTNWEYKNIKDFSVFEIGSKTYLVINPASKLGVPLKFPIKDAQGVAEKLNNYLPQVEYEEPLLEVLARVLRL